MAEMNNAVRADCFACKKGRAKNSVVCTALKECLCAQGEFCPFYMTKEARREKAARARLKNARNGIADSADWEKESKRL